MEKILSIYVIVVFHLYCCKANSQIIQKECMGLYCNNDGFVDFADGLCHCVCPTGYSGIFCELGLEDSLWPPGPYVLPMSKYGCPEPANRGWERGYINITTKQPMTILWSHNPIFYYNANGSSPGFHSSLIDQLFHTNDEVTAKGPFGDFVYQLNFCFKLDHINNTTGSWPEGDFGIYASEQGCPQGFTRYQQILTFPRILSWNADGHLPEFSITQNGTLEFTACLIKNTNDSIERQRTDRPFSVIKHTSSKCPTQRGFNIEHETVAVISKEEVQVSVEIQNASSSGITYCHYFPADWNSLSEELSNHFFSGITFAFGYKVEMQEQLKKLRNNVLPSGVDNIDKLPIPDGIILTPLSGLQAMEDVPWLLVDLHRTTRVMGIVSVLQMFIGGQGTWDEYPTLYVSDVKWSFLQGGAERHTYQTEYHRGSEMHIHRLHTKTPLNCTFNPFTANAGSVVTYANSLDPDETPSNSASHQDPNYNVGYDVRKRCHSELGMTDGAIDTFQITASSWHAQYTPGSAWPSGPGWCASAHDQDPYIQVDLLSTTLVEGVSIYNWYMVTNDKSNNIFRRTFTPMGARAFHVRYGFDTQSLRNYSTKEFEIDLSADQSTPQTYLFLKPFLARLVRFYPEPLSSLSCLRFELLGCRKARTKQLQCTVDQDAHVVNVSKPYISVSLRGSLSYSDILSWDECASLCLLNQLECGAIIYNTTINECQLTPPSETHNYQRYNGNVTGSFVSQKLCFSDSFEVKQMTFSEFNTDIYVHWGIGDNDVITSYGFPFHYETNQEIMWKIRVEQDNFINLVFTNISLHKYKDEDPFCKDVIFVTQTSVYIELVSLDDEERSMFTNQNNGDQPLVVTESFQLNVWFLTCLQDSTLIFRGSGFRAIVNASDVPYCQRSIMGPSEGCFRETMAMASMSYFRLDASDQQWEASWFIEAPLFNIIVLTLTDFSVECYSGTLFSVIRSYDENTLYCNLNRPPAESRSVAHMLEVRYSTVYSSKISVWEGFRAVYRFEKIANAIPSISSNTTVCSEILNKCFVFGTMNSTTGNFASSLQTCSERKMGLATLHSDTEMTFVRQLLHEFVYKRFGSRECWYYCNPEDKYIVFIGLNLVMDRRGKRREMWHDDSPVTFTAWASGEPADRSREHCSYMDFQNLNNRRPWRSSDCKNSPATRFFICEKQIKHSEKQGNLLHQWISEESQPVNTDGLFKCDSGEWISVLSRCDGLSECRDRSDEMNCPTDTASDSWSNFRCNNGRLISMSRVCDYILDCPQGEDEYCTFPTCKEDEFQCSNGQCLPDYTRCDATIDCIDSSDELDCGKCNKSVAFRCGDQTCIPSHLVCDHWADCADAEDEDMCEETSFDDCIQWWEAGYKKSGIYKIGYIYAECNFDFIWTEGIVRTIVHNRTVNIQYRLTDYERALSYLVDTNECQQQIYRTCTPIREEIANIDGIYPGKSYSECVCTMQTVQFSKPISQRQSLCNGDNQEMETYLFGASIQQEVPVWEITYKPHRYIRFTLDPMICEKKFHPPVTDSFLCVSSHTTIHASQRCLYDEDIRGRPLGCRYMEHLQGCEDFVCPADYVKCRDSFCIAIQLVCDGRRHCKDGEDEVDCWCKGPGHDVVILSFHRHNEMLERYINNLAEGFLSETNTVKIARVYATDSLQQLILLNPDASKPQGLIVEEHVLLWREWITDRFSSKMSYYVDDIDLMRSVTETLNCDTAACGVVFISDRDPADDVKGILVNIYAERNNIIFYRVTLDARISNRVEVSNIRGARYITVRDATVFSRGGAAMFPELCEAFGDNFPDGGYLCLGTRSVIPAEHVCDGNIQCPSGDDETLCNIHCPTMCSCTGYMADCRNVSFSDRDWGNISMSLRTIDLSYNKGITQIRIQMRNLFLIKLNISHCSVQNISKEEINAFHFPNLKLLDLSHNKITIIRSHTFSSLYSLEVLRLNGNEGLKEIEPKAFFGLANLKQFTLSEVSTTTLRADSFSGLDLEELDLSGNHITTVEGLAFNGIKAKVINLLSNDIKSFNKDMFTGASSVERLLMPAYKFCCVRPEYMNEEDCFPPKDEFSSCEDLMRNPILQTLLWLIGICAFLGNTMSLIYRILYDRKRFNIGYGIFVTNLAVADLLMGCYMIIIAIADVSFRKRYLWLDEYWRNSAWCTFAGALSTASSEASVLFICLITMDRLLVIKYPFGKVRFHARSAWTVCAIVWLFTITAAIIPIAYVGYFQDKFYAKSAVCLALPITRDRSSGWLYSVILFIGVNFITFVVIAIGQWLIYKEVANTKMKRVKAEGRRQDLHVARNLLFVASTDFMCWFPIGCMGIIALAGHPIPGDVYAWAAVLILPINSALNPFLYTLSAIIGKKRFTPDVDEASRSEYSKEQLVQLWNNETFARKSERMTGKSLHDYMDGRMLSVRTVYAIAVHLLKSIETLHEYHINHGNLSTHNVIVSSNRSERIRIILEPHMRRPSTTDKAVDIHDVGCIIRSMLQRVHRCDTAL